MYPISASASPTQIHHLVAIANPTRDLLGKPNVRATLAALDPEPLAVITASLARLTENTGSAEASTTAAAPNNADPADPSPGSEAQLPQHIIASRNDCAAALAAAGFTNVVISYSGCGDEGHLNDISSEPNNIDLTDEMHTMLSDFGDAYMEASGVNWYDNEGGGGTLTFNLVDKTFTADVYWNETVSETGFAEEDVPIETTRVCPLCKGSDPACQWGGIPANCSMWGKDYDTSSTSPDPSEASS